MDRQCVGVALPADPWLHHRLEDRCPHLGTYFMSVSINVTFITSSPSNKSESKTENITGVAAVLQHQVLIHNEAVCRNQVAEACPQCEDGEASTEGPDEAVSIEVEVSTRQIPYATVPLK